MKFYHIISYSALIFSPYKCIKHDIATGGREIQMSEVIIKDNESLDSALRRFKKNCAKAGIMQEIRKREHYEKPSVKRKKKSEAARKKNKQF